MAYWYAATLLVLADAETANHHQVCTEEALGNSILTHNPNSQNVNEFKCSFVWNEDKFLELRNDILDWMKYRQKSFIRFTVPVINYTNVDASLHNYTGLLVWAWVLKKHEYMLHYPQNFVRISAGTMGIVTEDWALDFDKNMSVSLRNFSFNNDNDNYEYEADVGYCDAECVKVAGSCGIGRQEIVSLLVNVSESDSEAYAWEYICLQVPYDDIIAVMKSHPNFAFPNIFYYMLFLKKLFVERFLPSPSVASGRTIQHYQCYRRKALSTRKGKELLESYFVIPLLAAVLWLYVPLLIYYLPSSSIQPTQMAATPEGMFPSHKPPNHTGRCLKTVLCYYAPHNGKRVLVCLRRMLFLFMILMSPYSLFSLPHYGRLACGVVIILVAAASAPHHISTYLNQDSTLCVLGWTVPPRLTQVNFKLAEYQLLASIMQEKIYLVTDWKFWVALAKDHCFKQFCSCSWGGSNTFWTVSRVIVVKPLLFIWGTLLLIASVVVIVFWYLVPLFYFLWEMAMAVLHMICGPIGKQSALLTIFSIFHGILVYVAILCVMAVLYFWCYAFVEVSLFTLIGGAMLPSMAYPYFLLVGSILGAIYTLVHSLHEDYENLIDEIITILNSEGKIPKANPLDVEYRDLVKTESNLSSTYTISVVIGAGNKMDLMIHTFAVTFLSRKMFDFVVDACHPVRKQLLFIALQLLAILFYALIILWVKNVYHLEAKMDTIFNLISVVAVALVPSLLQFLSYKNYSGRRNELKQNIYCTLIKYFAQLDHN